VKFRTEIEKIPYPFHIGYKDRTMLIGSCFTENIGNRLEENLFRVYTNPFGVVYNPMSVKRSLDILLESRVYSTNDLFMHEDLWHSWDHHSDFSGPEPSKVLQRINDHIIHASDFLKKSDFLFISLGTAWVYLLREDGRLVCNCHKVPAKKFDRQLLSIENIVDAWSDLLKNLAKQNPGLKIIFTVSPVRHWKDGAHGNQLSKSTLHLAINEIIGSFPESCFYFPSFELLIDDLRDYRYYAGDLLHPGENAIQYIWEYFRKSFFDDKTTNHLKQIDELLKASRHRFRNPDSPNTEKFMEKQQKKLSALKNELPFLNWSSFDKIFI